MSSNICGKMDDMTWEEIRAASEGGATVLLPTGSFEQHSRHLPVKTDTLLVSRVAEAVAKRLPEEPQVLLAPTFWLGASHHHVPLFALSVPERTYIDILTHIGGCLAESGFSRLFILNGHGGNSAPLRIAAAEMRRSHPALLVAVADYWSLAAGEIRKIRDSRPGGMGHSGEFETSMMEHLEPESVRTKKKGSSIPKMPYPFTPDLVDRGPVFVNLGWMQMTESGAIGDASLGDAVKGENFFKAVCSAVEKAITAFTELNPDDIVPG